MPLIANKVTEKELRDHLASLDYYANSARVHELELIGIERPGWVQVFRCHVEAKHRETGWAELFGVIRDDERMRIEFHLFPTEAEQQERIDELTVGMLTRPGSTGNGSNSVGLIPILGMLGALAVVAVVAALL